MLARNSTVKSSLAPDILIQAPEPKSAAALYVEQLGFKLTDDNPKMIALHGDHINLFSEPGPPLGPVLELTMDDVEEAKRRLLKNGCEIGKNEPDFPRTYVWGSIRTDLQPDTGRRRGHARRRSLQNRPAVQQLRCQTTRRTPFAGRR